MGVFEAAQGAAAFCLFQGGQESPVCMGVLAEGFGGGVAYFEVFVMEGAQEFGFSGFLLGDGEDISGDGAHFGVIVLEGDAAQAQGFFGGESCEPEGCAAAYIGIGVFQGGEELRHSGLGVHTDEGADAGEAQLRVVGGGVGGDEGDAFGFGEGGEGVDEGDEDFGIGFRVDGVAEGRGGGGAAEGLEAEGRTQADLSICGGEFAYTGIQHVIGEGFFVGLQSLLFFGANFQAALGGEAGAEVFGRGGGGGVRFREGEWGLGGGFEVIFEVKDFAAQEGDELGQVEGVVEGVVGGLNLGSFEDFFNPLSAFSAKGFDFSKGFVFFGLHMAQAGFHFGEGF